MSDPSLALESCLRDLRDGRPSAARAHWDLVKASRTPGFEPNALEKLRDRLCRSLDLCAGSPSGDAAVRLTLAETVLRMDPGNRGARLFAVARYSDQIRIGMRDSAITERRPPSAGKRRRLRNRLRLAARRLRRHLATLGRLPPDLQPDVVESYLLISLYFESVGERGLAVKMARRAKRLDPGHRGAREWIRRLRRRSRR